MKLSRRVSLNDKYLDNVDSRIVIQGIESQAGKETIGAVSYGARDGQRITNQKRDYLEIQVRFAIDIKQSDLESRAVVLENAIRWARGGGKLKVNYRPDRFVNVIMSQAPGEGDIRAWTNEYTITFRASAVPYWQDETWKEAGNVFSTVSNGKVTGNVAMDVPGNAVTYPIYQVTNVSGKQIDNVTVGIKSLRKIELQNIGLDAGEHLLIDHDDNDFLRIRIMATNGKYRSVMSCRTEKSDDDLQTGPGSKTFYVESTRAVYYVVQVRGRYL